MAEDWDSRIDAFLDGLRFKGYARKKMKENLYKLSEGKREQFISDRMKPAKAPAMKPVKASAMKPVKAPATKPAPKKKKPAPKRLTPKIPLERMPKVEGKVDGPGGFFSSVAAYRVQARIPAFEKNDPGVIVAASSPEHAVGALFRDFDTATISLTTHYTDRKYFWDEGKKTYVDDPDDPRLHDMAFAHPRNQIQVIVCQGHVEFKGDEFSHTQVLKQLDEIAKNIPKAIASRRVVVKKITSESELTDWERDDYLPYNSNSDDHYVQDYI